MEKKKVFAVGSILLVTCIWGISFVFMKNALDTLSPLWFLSCRFILASLLMALVNLKHWRRLTKKHWRDAFFIGIPLAAGYAFQTMGLARTTASNSAFITGTYVVLIPLISWLLTRKLQTRQLVIAVIACLGLAAISLDDQFRVHLGDFLVLLGALGFAIHFLVLDHFTKAYDSLLISGLQITVAAGLLTLAALALEPLPGRESFNPTVLEALVFTAVFSTCLGFLVQTSAQKVLAPVVASVLFTSESVFGAFFGVLLLHERLLPRQLLGGLLLIGCMVASVLIQEGGSPAVPDTPGAAAAVPADSSEGDRG